MAQKPCDKNWGSLSEKEQCLALKLGWSKKKTTGATLRAACGMSSSTMLAPPLWH
jgi:hypothetical protein